jgi:hypothetical protein
MTEDQILRIILDMHNTIDAGYSLEVAKRNAKCSTNGTPRYIAITRHPAYLDLLNRYCAMKKLKSRYAMIDGKIKAVKYVPEIKEN